MPAVFDRLDDDGLIRDLSFVKMEGEIANSFGRSAEWSHRFSGLLESQRVNVCGHGKTNQVRQMRRQ